MKSNGGFRIRIFSVTLTAFMLGIIGAARAQTPQPAPTPPPLVTEPRVQPQRGNGTTTQTAPPSQTTQQTPNASPTPQPTPLFPITPNEGVIVETESGQLILSQAADEYFNPASAVKVATALVAIHKLGADYHFVTNVFTNGALDTTTGTLNGDLFISGYDPSFRDENAVQLARELNLRGIKTVTGNIFVTPSFVQNFQGSALRSGDRLALTLDNARRPLSALRAWYIATGQPLPAILAPLAPTPAVKTYPTPAPNHQVGISPNNRAVTQGGTILRNDNNSTSANNEPTTNAQTPSAVSSSPATAAAAPQTALNLSLAPSVTIKGGVGIGAPPTSARLLFSAQSSALLDILKVTLSYSNNFMAEHVGNAVGGVYAMQSALASDFQISPAEAHFASCSGLGANRVTPRAMLKIYRALVAELAKSGRNVSDVLPVAGIDPGTLQKRYTAFNLRGSVIAKTGTLPRSDGGTSALVGQARTASGQTLYFVIFNRGHAILRSRAQQDALVTALQYSRGGPAPFSYAPRPLILKLPNPEEQTEGDANNN